MAGVRSTSTSGMASMREECGVRCTKCTSLTLCIVLLDVHPLFCSESHFHLFLLSLTKQAKHGIYQSSALAEVGRSRKQLHVRSSTSAAAPTEMTSSPKANLEFDCPIVSITKRR